MGTLDVAVFFVLAYTPSYLLLRTREGREWVIVACAIGWLLATLASFVAILAVDSALGVSTTLLANRTQAELSYGFLGGVLGIWQGARFAMLKRTGAIAKNKWLNWLALLLLVVLPVRFGESNLEKGADFLPAFILGIVTAVFLFGVLVVIRQGIRALRAL